LLLVSVTATAGVDGEWTLHKMTDAAKSKGAVCLDGSPAAYYLRAPLKASAPRSTKWVIFMEGGGWCGSDGNCADRALTDLGSSKAYPSTIANAEGTGLYDQFDTFNIVYAKYCDGSSFTGDVWAPVSTGKSTIYYRGRRILDALFDELLATHGLNAATELLFSGCSAGALTTYVHADYVSARMKTSAPAATTVALADAMFSLHHDDVNHNSANYYTRQFTWGYTAWNSSASINQVCRAAHSNESWVCFHGAVAAQFVQTPLFIANSKYDTWQARGVLSLNITECKGVVESDGTVQLCTNTSADSIAEENFWVQYGDDMVTALSLVPKHHSAFLTNCPTHCQTGGSDWRHPAFPGTRLDAAVKQWYPQAIAHASDRSWVAPRWIAKDGDKCVTPPSAATPRLVLLP
jgi:hypothetical protein